METKNHQIEILKARDDFPILKQRVSGKPLIYFDNAATTQKPKVVIDFVHQLYSEMNSNVHRGVHCLSGQMTEAYESARSKIKDYLNARSEKEIILTNGATAAINLAAFSFGEAYIQPGDEIIVTAMEHHSNLVPWQIICQRKGAILKIVPFSEQGELLLDEYEQLFSPRTKIVAIVHVSNSLGTINPVKRMIETAHQAEVPVLIDGAQAISHTKVDVQDLDCDFYAFSGHKMYGPTGTGILYGKERWLQEMPPYQSGGDMIEKVTLKEASYNELPFKFEAGTPNYIGLAGLGLAADYLTRLGLDRIQSYENQLLEHATKQLSSIKGLKFYGQAQEKICNISFSLDGASPYDVGLLLDKMGIAVRTGHHCTQPIWDYYGVEGSVRASLAFYNTIEEIDAFVAALHKIKEMF